MVVFLGILLNGEMLNLSIPLEKQERALKLLNDLSGKKKATIKQLQVLMGYLNFLTKAIFAGRTFTRRIYSKFSVWQRNKSGKMLKQHHHIRLDEEFRFDCETWKIFLTHFRDQAVCCPMVDLDKSTFYASQLNFVTDASANTQLGFGAVYNNMWLLAQWEPEFIRLHKPSIEYLELFALVAAIISWGDRLQNMRIIIFCNNQAIVSMINNLTSSCHRCMYLIRLLTLNNLVNSRRVFMQYIKSKDNELADALSRLQFCRFWSLAPPTMNWQPTCISPLVWPLSKLWLNWSCIPAALQFLTICWLYRC